MADVNEVGSVLPVGLFDATPINSITICPSVVFNTTGLTAFTDHLEVTFSNDIVLSGPGLVVANWFVTTENGRTAQISSVSYDGDTVTLGISPMTEDATYTLHLPTAGISSVDFEAFTGLWSIDYLGLATPVDVQMIRAVDTHHIDVIFAIAVDETTASDIDNYAIDGGLTITASTKITDLWYRLTNDPRQEDGFDYTLVVSNVEPK